MSYLFTSESVSEGHPDKVCDQISDAVLDAILAQDKFARVACESFVTTGLAFVGGEITTDAYIEVQDVVRQVIRDIGYTKAEYRFDAESCSEVVLWPQQLPSLDAEGLRDAKDLVGDTTVQSQQHIEFFRRQEVPVRDGPPEPLPVRVIAHHALLDVRVHSPVHPPDPLHQPHRVPVQVVVDQPQRVLQVQALRQDVVQPEVYPLWDTSFHVGIGNFGYAGFKRPAEAGKDLIPVDLVDQYRELRTQAPDRNIWPWIQSFREDNQPPSWDWRLPIDVGNLKTQKFSDIWLGDELFKAFRNRANLKGSCGRCRFKFTSGGSRARASAYNNGDMLASDPGCTLAAGTKDA